MATDKSRPTPEADPLRPGELLARTVAAVEPASVWAAEEANALQARLTKPRGSLGRLEQLGARLAAAYGVCPPLLPHPAAVAVFAGDHGVHAQASRPGRRRSPRRWSGTLLTGERWSVLLRGRSGPVSAWSTWGWLWICLTRRNCCSARFPMARPT